MRLPQKLRFQSHKWTTILCFFLLFTCTLDNETVLLGPETAQFDINLFEQNLIDYVNWGGDQPVGWAYAITQNGQLASSGAFGNLIQEPDGTTTAISANSEINIASVTKFYTAIAVLQLLDRLNLTVHATIEEFIPPNWTVGENMNAMTFAHLLRHESGLDTGNTDFDNTLSYAGIKQAVEDGVPIPPPDQSDYDNINFAIFRILIPSMQNQIPNAPQTDLDSDSETQEAYKDYMQSEIFSVCGLPNVDFTEPTPAPRYYNKDDVSNGVSGTTYGDWDNKSGGGGYYMSVIEMAAVNAFFQHSEDLLSNEDKQVIRDNYMGLDAYFNGDSRELHGKYYGKNGSIGNDSDPTVSQGMLSQIQMFPINGVEIAVFVNSRNVTYKTGVDGFLRSSIKEAYNDAWIDP